MSLTHHISILAVAATIILTQEATSALLLDNAGTKYQVYYDGSWKPVPLLAVTNVSTVARTPQRRYGLLPCECADLQCGCCVNTNFFSTQRSGCMNMTYDPKEFAIGMNMLWNGDSVYQNSISAKNPPPACMEAPVPYLPSIQFCIKLFDIHTQGKNIHTCINFETRVARAPILVLEFDCVEMGVDGFDHVKFNSTMPEEEIASDSQDTNIAATDIPKITAIKKHYQGSTDIPCSTANPTASLAQIDVTTSTTNKTANQSSTEIPRSTVNRTESL